MKKKTRSLKKYFRLGVGAVKNVFTRFPLTILLFLGLAGLIIYRMEVPYESIKHIEDILDRITGVMALGVPLSLSVALLLERLGKEGRLSLKILALALVVAFLFLDYLYLFTDTDTVSMTRLFLMLMAFTLIFFFIPFLPQRGNFETYVTRVLTGFATSAFFTIVLGLGVMAIFFAIQSLLYHDLSRQIYGEIWVLAWLVFAPFHFLYELPDSQEEMGPRDFNLVIKVMLIYIVLPLMSIYTLVLYTYFGKILITQIWPKGIVSYLVVSYTVVGLIAIFLITPFLEENRWTKMFTSIFTKVIFPLLGMMFVAIILRINQYGFTENRYFILVIGLWSILMMIFLNFDKGRRNIVLPVTLAIFALLAVNGPWSAFEVSKSSQSQRFYQIATEYDLIEAGQVVKNSQNIEVPDQRELTSVLEYFDRYHSLNDLVYLPDSFTMDQMKAVFGFEAVYDTGIMGDYFSYYWGNERTIIVSDYDYFFPVNAYRDQSPLYLYEKEIITNLGKISIVINTENKLSVNKGEEEIYQFDLGEFAGGLYEKHGSNLDYASKSSQSASQEESMVWEDETDKIKIMVVFENLYGNWDKDQNLAKVESMGGEIFLKIK